MKLSKMGAMVVALLLSLGCGCGPSEEELKLQRQIQAQIKVIDEQVKALNEHQTKMQGMIKEMQTQLAAMESELASESPRIEAANKSLLYLRELTTIGFGESPGRETLRNPAYSIGWLLLFVLLLWLFYRLRHRKSPQS